MKFAITVLLTLLLSTILDAQTSRCAVGDVDFACPDDFKEVKVGVPNVRIFKYSGTGNDLYFFMTVPQEQFDPTAIGNLVPSSTTVLEKDQFAWKSVEDPLVMSTITKSKFDLTSVMGLSSSRLIEVKSFAFQTASKRFVLGYVSDWTEDSTTNRKRFEAGKGIGDNAAGCNAVVTALNSVTHEFKESKQYCFLSSLGAPK